MPPAAAPAAGTPAAGGAEGQPAQQRGGGYFQGLIRMVMMYYMFKQFTGSAINKGPGAPDAAAMQLNPMLSRGSLVDVHCYISEKPEWQDAVASETPIWLEKDVPVATGEPRYATYLYRPSQAVQNNGSVYFHAIFTPLGASANPRDPDFDSALSWAKSRPLNSYLPKRRAEQGVNLLSGKNSTDNQPLGNDTVGHNETVIVSYLKPNVTIALVDDFTSYQMARLPPHLLNIIDIDKTTSRYRPHTWYNEFWMLRDYLVPVNETLTELPLHLSIEAVGPWKFAFFVQMEQSFSMQQSWGMSNSGESDEVKRIFLEGNPIFLALTIFVSMLHSVFDVLAFKNDIGFWKDNKSMRGLSARTILINAGCQLVIFLYLLDSETSFVVLMSTGVGTAIEFWKVTKAMNVGIARTAGGIPYITFKDRDSYTSSKTDQYDAEAMQYLSYALYPLVGGYAIYSLMYSTHKSWYSWILHSLVGAVYTFGFILMCPQLYLNYKLKSVAHLPWRQMTYKFLNTIIDDLFAFVIKMPLLHRLSVFRDDLVFLVYIYQRWIYRVDKTRANEFGYAEEEAEEEERKKKEEEEEASKAAGTTAKPAIEGPGEGAETSETKKDK